MPRSPGRFGGGSPCGGRVGEKREFQVSKVAWLFNCKPGVWSEVHILIGMLHVTSILK